MSKSPGKKSFRIDDLLSRKSIADDPRSHTPEHSPRCVYNNNNVSSSDSRGKPETSHHQQQSESSQKLFHTLTISQQQQNPSPSQLRPQLQFQNPGDDPSIRQQQQQQHIWEDSSPSSVHEMRRKQEQSFFNRYNNANNAPSNFNRNPGGLSPPLLSMFSHTEHQQLPSATLPFGSLGHYRDTMQRTPEIVHIPFPFYNGLPPISAFRTFCPNDGSLPPDELARSYRHQASAIYEASLAYLGTNPSSFSMTSLLSGSGNKRKGGQIRFTNYQTSQLEKSFTQHKYLNANDRKKLANSLALSDRQVKTWFQNRRAKWRKTKEIGTDIEGEASKSPFDQQSYSPDGNCDSSAASGPEAAEHSP